MALDSVHFDYPHRSHGMDHQLYDWSMLADRPAIRWPDNNKLALWINVSLQFFPLDQQGVPFKVPGGMTMPYPDLRHYTLRDYGNRVGIYRILKAFDRYSIRPSFAVNAQLALRLPYLMDAIKQRGDEVICHGQHMDALHYGGQDRAEEQALVTESIATLRTLTGQAITGWLSPARNQSEHTLELLAEAGIEYCCDWVNDDLPYPFTGQADGLWAMPLSTELDDQFVLMNNLHSEDAYAQQLMDACEFLLTEAEQHGGRMLALNIHPWLLGQPHRIGKLETVLDYLCSRPGVWSASPADILATVKAQG